MVRWRWEWNGTMVWLLWSLLIVALATGCHSGTNQGSGAEQRAAVPGTRPQTRQQAVPTADQVQPSSPEAVLGGTSTTRPAVTPGATGSTGQSAAEAKAHTSATSPH